jgi:Lrp/AsnC family leucine-responsive transcriptional regulator
MPGFRFSGKDMDILFELSLNARISITELAKRAGMSKQAVSYRLGLLEKNNVILGYHAITNIYMLGMTHYRVFLKYENMGSWKEQEFSNYLLENPKIVWVAYLDGDLDAAFLCWAKNIREFEKTFDEVNKRFGAFFQEKVFSIATKIEYLKYRFLSDKGEGKSIIFGDCLAGLELDELDRKILNRLNRNGRETLVELSQACDSSPKVIKTRLDGLLKKKIIAGFNVKIDHKKLGFTHRKVFLKLNDNSSEKVEELSEYLRSKKSTIYLVKPVGSYDFEFELMTKSNEEFHDIMKEIRARFAANIKSYDTVIIFAEPKSGQMAKF